MSSSVATRGQRGCAYLARREHHLVRHLDLADVGVRVACDRQVDHQVAPASGRRLPEAVLEAHDAHDARTRQRDDGRCDRRSRLHVWNQQHRPHHIAHVLRLATPLPWSELRLLDDAPLPPRDSKAPCERGCHPCRGPAGLRTIFFRPVCSSPLTSCPSMLISSLAPVAFATSRTTHPKRGAACAASAKSLAGLAAASRCLASPSLTSSNSASALSYAISPVVSPLSTTFHTPS